MPYAAEAGRVVPAEAVSSCPTGVAAGERCELLSRGFRHRTTGPKHPIRRLRCLVHGYAFTVYPPGHVPYGRVRWAPVDLAGHVTKPPDRESGEAGSTGDPASLAGVERRGGNSQVAPAGMEIAAMVSGTRLLDSRWEETFFAAAVEAAKPDRPLWSSDLLEDEEGPTLRTQRRRVRRAIATLGLAPGLADSEGDRAAATLAIPAGDHRAARREAASARTLRERAAAVVRVLALLDVDDGVFARLIGSGLLAGVFSEAGVWDGVRRRLLFPAAGMRPVPPRFCGGSPPPRSPSRPTSRSP